MKTDAMVEAALLELFPLAKGRSDAASWAIDRLIQAERYRRSSPDSVSGAFHVLALTQGALLKEEFDLSTHAHHDGWVLGAVVVDPIEFIHVNMRYGFEVGDRVLRAIVTSIQNVYSKSKVVRIHTDALAAFLGPTSELCVDEAMVPALRASLKSATQKILPDDGSPPMSLEFTVALLEMTVVDPPNWQMLGPLAWAECERALVCARRNQVQTIIRRRFELHGRIA